MSVKSSEELLHQFGSAIRAVTFEVHASTRGTIGREELFDLGVEGMLDAARRFDPAVGVQFWTFVYPRVRGTMMDAVRQSMPLPVRLHRGLGAAEAALRTAVPGTRAHQEATQRLDEATEAVGLVSPEVLAIARGETLGVDGGESADASLDASDGPAAGACSLDDGSASVLRIDQAGAEEQLEIARRAAAIHAAMRQLTVEERMIVRGLYFEDRGLLDLGGELGVSKSWASRIHTRALGRLKTLLAADWGYEAETERAWGATDAQRDWSAVLFEGAASGEVEVIETEEEEATEAANAA